MIIVEKRTIVVFGVVAHAVRLSVVLVGSVQQTAPSERQCKGSGFMVVWQLWSCGLL